MFLPAQQYLIYQMRLFSLRLHSLYGNICEWCSNFMRKVLRANYICIIHKDECYVLNKMDTFLWFGQSQFFKSSSICSSACIIIWLETLNIYKEFWLLLSMSNQTIFKIFIATTYMNRNEDLPIQVYINEFELIWTTQKLIFSIKSFHSHHLRKPNKCRNMIWITIESDLWKKNMHP